jgi:hypothetical protein
MTPDVQAFAFVSIIIVGLVASLSLIAVFVTRSMMKAGRQPKSLPQQDDRLEHLQQSIDAIAIEVERIAEAQRFSAKLLADRVEERQLSR